MKSANKRKLSEVTENGWWWELRVGNSLIGRSTSKTIVERWRQQFNEQGSIDAESNV